MLKHVVMFKLHNRSDAQRASLVAAIESLREGIDVVRSLEVGVDCLSTALSYDVIATVTVDDRAALEIYSKHPKHRAVLAVVRELSLAVAIVDYETP